MKRIYKQLITLSLALIIGISGLGNISRIKQHVNDSSTTPFSLVECHKNEGD